MIKKEKIFIKLLDEDVNVYKPVDAILIKKNIYEIIGENKEDDCKHGEKWEFNKNDIVECKDIKGDKRAIIKLGSK